jgi:hypothetical protein
MVFVNTVSENMSRFTKREIKGAELARSLCRTLDRSSMKDYKWIIQSHQIKDSLVAVQDIDVAISIWGKNYHPKQISTGYQRLHQGPQGIVEAPPERVPDDGHNLREQNPVFFCHLAEKSVLRLFIILRTARCHTHSRPSRRFTNVISIAAFASLSCMLMESSLL